MKEQQTLSNVFIVDPPRLPLRAEFPTKLHLLVLGFALSLGSGIIVALAKEQLLDGGIAQAMPSWAEPIEMDEPARASARYAPVYEHYEPTESYRHVAQVRSNKPVEQHENTPHPPVAGAHAERLEALQAVSYGEPFDPFEDIVEMSMGFDPASQMEDLFTGQLPVEDEPVAASDYSSTEMSPEHHVEKTVRSARKKRSLPAFLVGDVSDEMDEIEQTHLSLHSHEPVSLDWDKPLEVLENPAQESVARKSVLAPGDDLLQDVAPLTPPVLGQAPQMPYTYSEISKMSRKQNKTDAQAEPNWLSANPRQKPLRSPQFYGQKPRLDWSFPMSLERSMKERISAGAGQR